MANILQDLKRHYKYGGILQKLLFWNIGVSIVFFICEGLFSSIAQKFFYWTALSSDYGNFIFKPWTLLTYSFLHAGIVHLILNMLVLYFVYQLFRTFFNDKQFLTCYLLGAMVGGIFFLIGSLFFSVGYVLVGASAAVIAPLIGLVTYSPNMEVRLMLIGRVKIWYIAAFIILLDIIQLSSSNIGGHLAHLGGAFMGFVYIKLVKEGKDLSVIFDRLANLFKRKKGTPFKKVYVNKKPLKASAKGNKDLSKQQKIDIILDKISKSGYESLTKEEKAFLFRSGKEE